MRITQKTILGAVLFVLSAPLLFSQSIDEKRMNRDLKVAENILNTLISGENRFRFGGKTESNYMPGFGVIFSIPQTSYVVASGPGTFVYEENNVGYVIRSSDDDEEGQERRRKREEERVELFEEAESELKENLTSFLVDYADLIGQIKPSERIVVQTRSRDSRVYFSGGQLKSKQNVFTAHILKSDLIAYKQGKLDRDEVSGRVVFKSPDENEEVAKDLELFATIFARLYESDLSSTYYISSRNIGYTSLDGFGVTYNMKVYSSSSDRGYHKIHTTGESGLTYEERNEKVNAMYPEFEQTLKENLMDYGRTIKSLEPDEMLVMKVALTECKGCEMPKELEVALKGKVLKNYDKGSISREDGIKQMTVKRKEQ